jgi:MFS transporter, DHA2 family, multidrug resistance protein
MEHTHQPFRLPDIRNLVPEKLKPFVVLAFVLVYQLSGGVYFAAVSQISGSLALMQQDVMMAGYASLVGLSLTFAVVFRLKFAVTTKTSLLITASALIACNLVVIHTHSVPVLVAVSFVSGFFRMWGTFACNTTIQLWVTPKRDMAVWFVFIGLLVQSAIQLSGIFSLYSVILSKWQNAHWIIVGLLLFVVLGTLLLFKQFRFMKRLPLYGIDWTGMALWATTLLSIIFVLNYGDHYDWFQSVYIRVGALFAAVSLALNLWRASFIRHPYIALSTWKIRKVWLTFLLYILLNILLSPAHLLEHLLTDVILGYDSWHSASLNWVLILGTGIGVFITYVLFAKRRFTYKVMTLIGFSFAVAYLVSMYLLVDAQLPKELLAVPLLLRGAGYVIISITFLMALSGINFNVFPQTLTIQGFASACLGALFGSTLLHHFFNIALKKNVLQLSAHFDSAQNYLVNMPQGQLYGALQKQALLVSMKELYGWLCLLGLFSLLAFLLKESSLRSYALHPRFSNIRNSIKRQLQSDKSDDERHQ